MKSQEKLQETQERIEALKYFIKKVNELYERGMEYQLIAKEIGISLSNLSLARNDKRIPSLEKLRTCNERLKKL